VIAGLVLAVLLAALCGVAAAGLYLTWPRRLTAEEYVLHRRAISAPPVQMASPTEPARTTPDTLDAQL
jgi:hypothetical protein